MSAGALEALVPDRLCSRPGWRGFVLGEAAEPMDAHETRLKRLKFRAWHRGFVEADLILGPFVDTQAAGLSTDQLDRLEALLDESDQDIYAWILGRSPTPEPFDTDVMAMIRGFRFVAHAARQAPDA